MPGNFSRIALLAVVICLIDVLESISIAKALAYKNHYELKCALSKLALPMERAASVSNMSSNVIQRLGAGL